MEKGAKSPISLKEEDLTTDDINVNLIRCVKDVTFLYSKTDKRYCDRNLTEATWANIGFKLGMTKEEAKRRWTRLRNNYCKVIARRRASAKTATRLGDSLGVKPWVYESDMCFLNKHMSSFQTQTRKMSLLENMVSQSVPRSPSLSPSVSDTSSSPQEEFELELEHHPQEHSPSLPAAPEHPSCRPTQFAAVPSGSVAVPISLVQSLTHDSHVHSPAKRQKVDEVNDTLLSYIRTLESEREEPLVGWFKTLLPSLKMLSPARLASFQIHAMQEMLKLVAEEERHQNPS